MQQRTIKLLALFLLLGVGLVLLLSGGGTPVVHADPGGASGGRSGAPGESTCTNCHAQNSGVGQFTITAPANYTPGTTYPITVRHTTTNTSRRRWGFQLTALTGSNARAGTLATLDATVRILNGGPGGARQYADQTQTGSYAGQTSSASWTFNWTAPASNVGPVTFYAAGVQCDNDGTEDGDQTYTATAAAQPGVAPPALQFSAAAFGVTEGMSSSAGAGSAVVTVTRSGNTAIAASVDYATSDGTASQRTDYTTAAGTLNFAAGETSVAFPIIITDDTYAEAPETIMLTLSNPSVGASLGTQPSATLTITDNDIGTPTTNPIDDARFFVQQHYSDFLNRIPDQDGWDYWAGQVSNCRSDAACVNSRRIGVSGAFFVELEFQQTGFVVYRLYRAAFGVRPAPDQTRANVLYAQFMPDRAQLVGGPQLEPGTVEFANRFVQRPAFLARYPATQTNAQFVNLLFDTANLTPFAAERQAEIDAMNNQGRTRAQVLRNVTNLPAFRDREYNAAFVLMQYFGYLRRDPDQNGYDFWLNMLNAQPSNARGMLCAFLTSTEYQERFSSIVTRNNTLCNGNP